MKFAAQHWMYLILILPLCYLALRAFLNKKKANLDQIVKSNLLSELIPRLDWKRRIRKTTLILIGLTFVFIALSRPQWGQVEEKVFSSGLDIVFVLDLSNSMLVEDVVPNRLQKSKHFLKRLIQSLRGDRMAIVAFARSTFLASPLTTDSSYISEILDTLEPKDIQNQGTDIGLALETAADTLMRGAEEVEKNDLDKNDLPSRVVILVSDGEDLEGKSSEAIKKLKELSAHFYSFGVGTESGGPVPIRDQNGTLRGYKKDRQGKPVVSKFDSSSLKKISEGNYWQITPAESEADAFLKKIGALDRKNIKESVIYKLKERYQIPLLIAVIILLIELFVSLRKPVVLLISCLMFFYTSSAHALGDFDVYLENEKGLKKMEEGKVSEAKKHFNNAQAKKPDSPELHYNQGAVHLQQGETELAINEFDIASRKGLEEGKLDLAAKGFYNLGSAFEANGKTEEAIVNHLKAIEVAKSVGDQEVEKESRKKIESLIQQKQDQKNKDQKQSQNNEDKDDKDKDKDKNSNSGNDQNKNKKYSRQNPKKQFESKTLRKEDAERVMAELSNKEKELQKKFKVQKGKGANDGRDW